MRENLTFVLTDVESSTALWERWPELMAPGIARHIEIISEAVASHGGRLHRDRGEGDSTFSVFRSAPDAVAAAATAARALAAEPWSAEAPVRVRIVVYTGEAEERDGDFLGASLNRAARVRSLAFGGQILLGSATAELVDGALPGGVALVDLGPRPLKDVSEPERVFELRLEDAGALPEPLSDVGCSNLLWLERAVSRDFVGRDDEQRVLAEAWSTASSGHRVLALVGGEPGVGKTALVGHAARDVHAAGGLVLFGRWDEEVLAPFQGFREALATYAQGCPRSILRADLRDHGVVLSRLFPEVAARIDAAAPSAGTAGEVERLRLFEAVERWLEAIAVRRPVLLVLDDVHWIDRPSVLLLQHLVRSARPCSLLIVATYRDTDIDQSELGRALPELYRDRATHRILLRGLEVSAVRDLVERATAGRLLDAEAVATELQAETGGNPFFVQEIVRHLNDTGDLERAAVGEAEFDVPDSVRDVVRWRLSRLSNELSEGLSVASVLGQEFDFSVLTIASDIGEERLLDALDEACRAGLAHEDAADHYVFSHAVVRRTLLDDISVARRLRLHRRVAEALEQQPRPGPLAELAHHYCAAASLGLAPKAIGYARAAGERAMAELAYEAAVHHYKRALEVQQAHHPEDDVLRCALMLSLGDAHERAGEYADRDTSFLAAAAQARKLGHVDLFIQAALGYGGVLPAAVDPNLQGHALLEEALEMVGEQDSRERALVLSRLAHWLHFVASRSRRLALADEALGIARRLGDPADLAAVLVHRVWALDGPDDLEEQLVVAEEILSLGEQLDDTVIVLDGLRCRCDARFEMGDMTALRADTDELARLARELRYPEYIRLARSWDALYAAIEGRFEEALQIADEVHAILGAMGHQQTELVYTALTFPIRWLRGELGDALPLIQALGEAEPWRDMWPAIEAWCASEAGQHDRAHGALSRARPPSGGDLERNYLWWATIAGFSNAAMLLGDREWAEFLYDLAVPYADRLCAVGQASFLGAVAHYLGALAATLEWWDDAERHFTAALERHEAMNARPFLAVTQQSYARMLLDRGDPADRARARALEDAALQTAAELGLHAVTSRASIGR